VFEQCSAVLDPPLKSVEFTVARGPAGAGETVSHVVSCLVR
jgi:hypothetical protein